ncbi:MAG: MATE family efflux transporter [Lachnospiraceae bacterium]|nr:MATE family efflux transporter [Lachnospiraceae bacterium]
MEVSQKKTKKSFLINEKTPLMLLAGPMFLEMFLNILVNNIDTIMLSRYSENAPGAVGNANQVLMLMILMFNIIATATSVVVAQYLGAKQYDKMNTIYSLAFVVNLAFGVFCSVLIVAAKNPMLTLLKVPENMRENACIYINIVGGSLFLQACYNVMLQILRCNGYSKVGMYISVAINVINIVGNYLFLYGPLAFLNLGVAGVAISTAVARLVALTSAVIYFYCKKVGKIQLSKLRPFPGSLLLRMIRVGLPSAGENMSYTIYQMVLLSFINQMGDDASNTRALCNTLIAFAMVFSNSAAMATQIITGHLVGAGKEGAAYRRVFATLRLTLPITVGLATVNWLISPWTMQIFDSNETVIHLAFWVMFVDIFIEIGRCLNMTFVSSLKAAGDYMFPLFVGLLTMWLIGVPMGYICGNVIGFGLAGVFMGTAFDECIRGLITMARWHSRKWTGKRLVEEDK